jgi:pimeloyl-ACP methyl ester carboxylesterase
MPSRSFYRTNEGEKIVMAFYDAALKHWPVPFDTLRAPTRHGETFAIASGRSSKPPLILLHGACSNSLSWIGDVEAYSRDFRVYAVDIPGEPGRSAANRPDWNGPAFAEWLEDFISANRITRPSLLGISQGGWTALKYAVSRPQIVEKLILLTPAGIINDKLSFILSAILFSALGKRGAGAVNRLTFGREFVNPEALKFMNAIMTHFKPRIGKLNLFTDAELHQLIMPVLLLGGQKDAIRDSQKIAARLSLLLPDLTVSILPDKGHVLVNTSAEILAFLRNQ